MQLLSYMKLLDKPLGLVINFGESTLGGRAKCRFAPGGIPPSGGNQISRIPCDLCVKDLL